MAEVGALLDFLNDAGLVGVGVIIIIGLMRKWWVPGWFYKSVEDDKNEWKTIALKATGIAERTVKNGS